MKLRKSRENVVLSGVLGGLGEYLNIDPTMIRIGFVLLFFANISIVVPLYLFAAILLPKADKKDKKIDKSPIDTHNDSYISEINEDDWSDF